ncbi:hypothetical protein FOA52_013700 [Chlamydomonas sp. UWO 241]|nr:hypothetical protein FOA52_013700 [Chlamydomonas sp. UWO 241]
MGTRVIKGEDIMLVSDFTSVHPECMMYLVCDGHSGVDAAEFVASHLEGKLLAALQEVVHQCDLLSPAGLKVFAERLRMIIRDIFMEIEEDWSELGHMAGTTVTLCLVIGELITVANLGDSAGVVDTGCSMLEMTDSHRIQSHESERVRLKAQGCTIAALGFHLQGPAKPGEPGVGPLRIWPGGLCVSRSIGDLDAGPHILAMPHIKQVIVPRTGCRIIMASDGLWDVITLDKAIKLVRAKTASQAAQTLADSVLRDQRFMDDTSVIVVDILPLDIASFPVLALQMGLHPLMQERQQKASKASGFCSCFSSPVEEPDSREMDGTPGHLQCFADVDTLKTYTPPEMPMFHPNGARPRSSSAASSGDEAPPKDYTLHNASAFFDGGKGRGPGGSPTRAIAVPSVGAGRSAMHATHLNNALFNAASAIAGVDPSGHFKTGGDLSSNFKAGGGDLSSHYNDSQHPLTPRGSLNREHSLSQSLGGQSLGGTATASLQDVSVRGGHSVHGGNPSNNSMHARVSSGVQAGGRGNQVNQAQAEALPEDLFSGAEATSSRGGEGGGGGGGGWAGGGIGSSDAPVPALYVQPSNEIVTIAEGDVEVSVASRTRHANGGDRGGAGGGGAR